MNNYDKSNETILENRDNNKFENIRNIKSTFVIVLCFVLGIYVFMIKYYDYKFRISFIIEVILIYICMRSIVGLYQLFLMHNYMNYMEYVSYLKKILRIKDDVGIKTNKRADTINLSRCIISTQVDALDDFVHLKSKETFKRFVIEEYIIREDYEKALEILKSITINTKDFRDDYLKLLVDKKYEEAIKVIDTKKNRYKATAVINSFWKGFCLNKLGKSEEAIKEFIYCSNNGGDSKYKTQSEIYLNELQTIGTSQEVIKEEIKKDIIIDKFYKDIRLWIYLIMILLILIIHFFI